MKKIDYYPKTFDEIPQEEFEDEDILLVIAEESTKSGCAMVFLVEIANEESVTIIAKFWEHELAVRYSNIYETIEFTKNDVVDASKITGDINTYIDLIKRLACWSRKYPRSRIYNAGMQSQMDGELTQIEDMAKILADLNKK